MSALIEFDTPNGPFFLPLDTIDGVSTGSSARAGELVAPTIIHGRDGRQVLVAGEARRIATFLHRLRTDPPALIPDAPYRAPSFAAPEQAGSRGIYIASKTTHAPRWRQMRDGMLPIISTWIDEAGPGETRDFTDLWRRCVDEAKTAAALIVYREPHEVLKGAWVEVGAALAAGVPVFAVGCVGFSVHRHAGITNCTTLEDAVALASAAVAEGRS